MSLILTDETAYGGRGRACCASVCNLVGIRHQFTVRGVWAHGGGVVGLGVGDGCRGSWTTNCTQVPIRAAPVHQRLSPPGTHLSIWQNVVTENATGVRSGGAHGSQNSSRQDVIVPSVQVYSPRRLEGPDIDHYGGGARISTIPLVTCSHALIY